MKKRRLFFTAEDVVKRTGWGRTTVWKWAVKNLVLNGRDFLWTNEDIEKFIKENGIKGEKG